MKRFLLTLSVILLTIMPLIGRPAHEQSDAKHDAIQRTVSSYFDLQKNTKSNIDFYTTNFGIFGNVFSTSGNSSGGGFWPKYTSNQYIFGAGVWFGAIKNVNGKDAYLVEQSYDPYRGASNMAPGRISDGDSIPNNPEIKQYRTYFSTDFKKDGTPTNSNDGPNWPIWLQNDTTEDKMASPFILDESKRNKNVFPVGPAYLSEQDILSVYKDTDLRLYDALNLNPNPGFPLRMQYEQRIYSWSIPKYKDMIVIKYSAINYSSDTLYNCYIAPVFDFDIGTTANASAAATNDHATYYSADPSLNLGYAWTDTDKGELGYGFGYIGVSLLETPAVDINKFVRHDKSVYSLEEQIGLTSFQRWTIKEDDTISEKKYKNFMMSKALMTDGGPADQRVLFTSGPFNLRPAIIDNSTKKVVTPGDTATVTILLAIAKPGKGGDADNTAADIAPFVNLIKEGRYLFLGSRLTADVKDGIQPGNFNILSVNPNPATDNFRVDYLVSLPGALSFELYNLLGNKVFSKSSEISNTGINSADISTNGLPAGSYLLKMSFNGRVEVRKIVIIK